MEWQIIVALVVAISVILFPVAYVWYLNIGGIYAAIKKAQERRAARQYEGGKTTALATIGKRVKSSILAVGRPIRMVLPVAIPVGIYAFLIWFFLTGFGWEIALAVALAIPFVLIPVAFVWYLNASGLYKVIRDTRQRQRRRAVALRQAEEITRGKAIIPETVSPRMAA